jgi:2-phosphoglycerate kinase
MTAARAVTAPETHPGLHVMARMPFVEYFTTSGPERLIADATTQHEAVWPIIEKVTRDHARWGPSIVIDGWTIRPERVRALGLENVTSLWLVIDPAVLEARERKNVDFTADSPDPERMLQNFLARSLWYNDFIRQQATQLGMPVLYQDGLASVDALCEIALGHCLPNQGA